MQRFNLREKRWYAAEFLGDEFGATYEFRSYSPIHVHSLKPLKSGKRQFQLNFYHAFYPEGVRAKSYQLETIERGEGFILCRSTTHQPPRLMIIYEIDAAWVRNHCQMSFPENELSLQDWLTKIL